ncbi:MAG TPA: serine protease [Candidatus Paceibacterota bacterium]|nr:hypothetical protein [uncultured archaeon]
MLKRILEVTLVMLVAVWIFDSYKSHEPGSKYFQPITVVTSTPTVAETEKPATTTTVAPSTGSGQAKKVVVKAKAIVVAKTFDVIPVIPTPAPPEPAPDFEKINNFTRGATMNILCIAKGSELSPISGTGIIISPDGLILTNAHVAQYLLLRNLYQKDFIQCAIRTGSPAYPRYHVELVYISPAWIEANKTELKEQNPQGTGENDFAFLHITDSIDGTPLPVFPYIPIDTREVINVGEPVVLVSYPAGFLGGLSILQGLSVTSAVTTVQDVFTFKADTIDVIDVGGTVVSQKGASGGAVVDRHGSLIGIISTSSSGKTTSSRELNAITLSYISRMLQNETGFTLPNFLSLNISNFANSFQNTTAVNLTKILTDELSKQ